MELIPVEDLERWPVKVIAFLFLAHTSLFRRLLDVIMILVRRMSITCTAYELHLYDVRAYYVRRTSKARAAIFRYQPYDSCRLLMPSTFITLSCHSV